MMRRDCWTLPAMAALALLLASCGSTPTAAPVIERSPNSTPLRPQATAAASKPAPATPAVTAAVQPTTAPAVPKTEKQPAVAGTPVSVAQDKAVAAEAPTTKPYREGDWRPEYHVVKKGDTLYSIALDYGQDYRELAAWNNLEDPALIKIDQRIRLFPPDSAGEAVAVQPAPLPAPVPVPAYAEPKARKLPYSEHALAQLTQQPAAASPGPASATRPAPKPEAAAAPPAAAPVVRKDVPLSDGKMVWEWPAEGKLLYGFGQGPIQKGIGIEGRSGQPVLAAAPGKVVYSGSGLRGYGKLIIIKHNASYLSVYAHNSRVLVKEGQMVAKGQKIAEIGDTDSDRVALHFEIRRLGKPIDPLQYLPERS
ncbi:MAG TPA: peptidoglycan DD-metalloendopeptidase family protein [Burkholderiales bacterium]|nr:peptidoglycan DD-metalloendopeptidase family protein [Burkholderiales bacterium]